MDYKERILKQVIDWEKIDKLNIPDVIEVFDVNETDFINYKESTFMIYSGISCTFKCDKENGTQICQNWGIRNNKRIKTSIEGLINKYLNQNISKSISFQGLEPLDNLFQLLCFIYRFRIKCDDPIIIWTGYTEEECDSLIQLIKSMNLKNIIIKFGRYIPGQKSHYDEILGIRLSSDNQYSKMINE